MKRTLLLMLLAACGDNGKPAAMMPDGPKETPSTAPRAVVVAGDFVTPGFSGVMSSLDITTMTMTTNVAPAGAIGNDPILRKLGNDLIVVNRFTGNNVTILDANSLAVKEQLSTGANSNPQDVATFADKLFVPATGTAGVVVLTRGSNAITTIDLSALDPDGKPDCVAAHRVGNDIYVACELLDQNFAPRGPGKIAVIDAVHLVVRATVTLSTPNPFGVFTELPNHELVIATFEFGNATSRCLEQIGIGPTPFSRGCLVQNSELGGYVVRAAPQTLADDTQMLFMLVDDGSFPPANARIWGYDLETNVLWDEPLTPQAQVLGDIAACPNGQYVVTDKASTKNGLRVYEGGQEKTTEPLAVGLNPQASPTVVCY